MPSQILFDLVDKMRHEEFIMVTALEMNILER
jgi:hypothetical protein